MRLGWCVLIVLAGCVPAVLPPQFSQTPGPPVQVTHERYETSVFSVERPAGWRVVTSAANDPASVIFVSPDDTALILVAVDHPEDPPRPSVEPGQRLRDRIIEVDGLVVFGIAPEADWTNFQSILEQTAESIRGSPSPR